MKPYGREKNLKGFGPSKIDVHPKKGWINWWEDRINFLRRGRMKQIVKKEIEEQIND